MQRRETSLLDFADEHEKAKTSSTDVFEGLWVRPMRRGCCEATIPMRKGCDQREQSSWVRPMRKGCCEATIPMRRGCCEATIPMRKGCKSSC